MKKLIGAIAVSLEILAGSITSALSISDETFCYYRPSDCAAPSVGSKSSDKYETMGFVGLSWNMGDNSPALIGGVRRTVTDRDNDVAGGKIDFTFLLSSKEFVLPTVRILGLAGNRDIQGEFGAGLQLKDWRPLLAVAAQGPYLNGGANYVFGEGLKPYIGVNTLKRPEEAKSGNGAFSCPSNLQLRDASTVTNGDPANLIVGGKICRPRF